MLEIAWEASNFSKGPNSGKAFQISIDQQQKIGTDDQVFSKSQMELLQKMFNNSISQSKTTNTTANIAQAGTSHKALSAKTGANMWILNSGATDHMTGSSNLFSTCIPCSGQQRVKIADGSFSIVASKGSIVVTKDLILESVLHVPNLSCNLISAGKLTKDLKCVVNFFPNGCIFQDMLLGKRIGSGKEVDGLFILEEEKITKALQAEKSSGNKDEIMRWHCRLGHPNFKYLKLSFPSLFENKRMSDFHCEMCEFDKHHQVSYPLKDYTPTSPFTLMHNDLWGPSRIQTVSGARWFVTFIDDHTRMS